jgi:hypothetical protein
MKRKDPKVEEPAAPYLAAKVPKPKEVATKPPGIRYAELGSVRKSNAQLMHAHREVLRKLAQ